MSPCERALHEGEVRCPIKQGTIAVGMCVTYQAVRDAERCFSERCHHTLNRAAFEAELRKIQVAEQDVVQIRRKAPGKRQWQNPQTPTDPTNDPSTS